MELRIAPNLQGVNPLEGDAWPAEGDDEVVFNLSQVQFARPSGLAFLYQAAFTFVDSGFRVRIRRPLNDDVHAYLCRANFWGILEELGLEIPDENWRGFNLGRAPNLLEPTSLPTGDDVKNNMNQVLALHERLRTALREAAYDEAPAVIFAALAENAAEHSRSERSAFVMAQAYRNEVEVAVGDVGIGIPRSLAQAGYSDNEAAVQAAFEELVTGRRDAAGNPREGGYGLASVAEYADWVLVRTDNVIGVGKMRGENGALVVKTRTGPRVKGTVIAAGVSKMVTL